MGRPFDLQKPPTIESTFILESREQRVMKLWREGYTPKEISWKVGKSYYDVCNIIYRRGLSKKAGKPLVAVTGGHDYGEMD